MKNLRGGIVIPIGTKIYCWEVIGEPQHGGGNGRGLQFHCRCICGTEKYVSGKSLRYGDSKSCGCNQLTKDMQGWKQEKTTCTICTKAFLSPRALLTHVNANHIREGEKYCSHCRQIKLAKEFTSQDRLCRKCRRENHLLHYDKSDLERRFNQAKSRALRRGIRWELTFAEYIEFIKNSCHYCGQQIGLTGSGLDRKNNEKVYSSKTVVPCCKRCNTMKSNLFNYKEMLQLAKVVKTIDKQRIKKWADAISVGAATAS